jgi:hypothetical protein
MGGRRTLLHIGRGQEGVPHGNVRRGVCHICGEHNARGRMAQAEEGASSGQLTSKILPYHRQQRYLGRADRLILPGGPAA